MNTRFPITRWASDDRPREKLVKFGHKGLTSSELLAILLGSGTPNESAVIPAQRMLAQYDNHLDQLAQCSVEELCEFHGVGLAKATRLAAAFELVRRHKQTPLNRILLSSSQSVFDFLQPHLGNLQHEEFWVIYLNQQHAVLSHVQLSRGGITQTTVDMRLAFKRAFALEAVTMILAHNHPSGHPRPSQSDHSLTKKFAKAGKNLYIRLLDYLIITENTYFSFADEGKL
jgi:DNA repair protein RadC